MEEHKNNSFTKGALCGALAMLLLAGGIFGGYKVTSYLSNARAGNVGAEESAAELSEKKLSSLRALIDKGYLGDVDEEALIDGIYKGYVSGLGDPYSVYYNEEETRSLLETTKGEYTGVGMVITQDRDTGIMTIRRVYDDSPADVAGIKQEDILYKVDGQDITAMDLTKVVTYIRGEEGTEVEITLLRGDRRKEVTITAVREKIIAQTVEHEMLEGNIGYLSVLEFDTVTYNQYETALSDLESQGMEGLIVDLRGNPGGNLSTVCEMLDLMLPEGLIVYTEDRDGNRKEYTSDGSRRFELPLTVLVDGGSASASEIYAGAIQDYGLGQIVGTTTYGKGVVQNIFSLGDNTCIKLTVSEYFTPNGRNIDGEGIHPDVEVEYEANEENPEADNQLDVAIDTLKGEM